MPTTHRTRVALGLSRAHILALIVGAMAIYNAMTQNASMFPSPTIALAVLLAQIQALQTAHQAVKTRALGLAQIRDNKRDILWTSLEILVKYVQGLCDASPELAATLIKGAAMQIAGKAVRAKPILQAHLGPVPGTVILLANATLLTNKTRKRVLYNWAWSGDGGKTWNQVASTPYAETEIPNLPLMATYAFRVCVTIAKNPPGEWSQSISLLVH